MNPDIFLMACAGFLMAFEPGPELASARWLSVLRHRFVTGFEAALHAALLLVFHERLCGFLPESGMPGSLPLFYALGAYALALLRRKDGRFLILSLIFGFSFPWGFSGIEMGLQKLSGLFSGAGLFALLHLCAQRRLLFSRPFPAFQGLPQTFLLAAFLGLALSSLEGLFGF